VNFIGNKNKTFEMVTAIVFLVANQIVAPAPNVPNGT
jgi:hypothetical protein